MSSKAYVKHYSEPPKISQAQLTSLAKPRPGTLHPDTELALLEADADYTEYAKRCVRVRVCVCVCVCVCVYCVSVRAPPLSPLRTALYSWRCMRLPATRACVHPCLICRACACQLLTLECAPCCVCVCVCPGKRRSCVLPGGAVRREQLRQRRKPDTYKDNCITTKSGNKR